MDFGSEAIYVGSMLPMLAAQHQYQMPVDARTGG